MTNEEMNRAVSESIEPFAGLPPLDDENWSGVPSPIGAWFQIADYGEGDEVKWYPRNWHTEETASAMLLERMPRARLDFHPARMHASDLKSMAHWVCLPDRDDQYTYESCPDRKAAIRNAYYAWSKR